MKRLLLTLAALLLIAASGLSPSQVYLTYAKAVDGDDLSAAKKYLSAERLTHIAGMSDSDAHAELSVISPRSGMEMERETIDGNDAVVIVSAHIGDAGKGVGTIKLTKEKGEWKVRSERWDLGGDPDHAGAESAYTPKNLNPAQKAAWRAIEDAGYADPSPSQFLNAAGHGDLDVVKHFIEAGFEVDTVSDDHTPLFVAAELGHDDMALYLIKQGANVNVEDEVHTTPLMRVASNCDKTALVRALLASGARTDIKSAGGATAEQLAHYSSCSENEQLIHDAATAKPKPKATKQSS